MQRNAMKARKISALTMSKMQTMIIIVARTKISMRKCCMKNLFNHFGFSMLQMSESTRWLRLSFCILAISVFCQFANVICHYVQNSMIPLRILRFKTHELRVTGNTCTAIKSMITSIFLLNSFHWNEYSFGLSCDAL